LVAFPDSKFAVIIMKHNDGLFTQLA